MGIERDVMSIFDFFPQFLGVVTTIIGYFLKKLHDQIEQNKETIKMLQKELSDHKIEDAKLYCTREEVKEEIKEIKDYMKILLSKIDRSREDYVKRSN